jgi:hypothetical protein
MFSLETIQYQHKDRFVSQLQGLLATVYTSLKAKEYKTTNQLIAKHPAIPQLETLFKDRLGLNIEITKDLYVLSPAAIVPFFGDYLRGYKTMGFYQTFGSGIRFGDILKKIETIEKSKLTAMKKAHNQTGYVDLKHAKVGGYLSALRHYLLLDFVWMYQMEITVPELAAIITHELGHAFDGLEEHYRLEKTNRAIFDILCDLRENNEDKALYRFRNTFTEAEFKHSQLSTDTERQDFCSELALQYLGGIKSQYLDDKYDETNFENMADSFATRFGMGKDIVSGLHKLHLSGASVLPRNGLGYGVLTLSYVLTGAVALLIAPPYGAIAYVGLAMLFMGKRNADMTYDLPLDRYQRVKNTIVNALKDTQLPKEVTQDLLEQIEFIDTLLEGFLDNADSLGDHVANFLSPSSRNAQYYIALQQSFERSLNNPLFIKSAELRVL